jgi:hypothetical protein
MAVGVGVVLVTVGDFVVTAAVAGDCFDFGNDRSRSSEEDEEDEEEELLLLSLFEIASFVRSEASLFDGRSSAFVS